MKIVTTLAKPATANKVATLKSIAKDLDITHTTVSNAFINPSKVSRPLREKILNHAKSVNYHGPNPAARYLRSGSCGAIGVIFNDPLSYAFTDPHDIVFLKGVASACEQDGTNLVLIPLDNRSTKKKIPFDALVDGYILNAPYKNNPNVKRALSRGLPTVVVDFNAPQHVSVLTNDKEVMTQLTEYLLSLGHQNIGIITFPLSSGGEHIFTLDDKMKKDNYVAYQRILGCKAAIERRALPTSSVLICETVNNRIDAQQATRKLLELQPSLTAIICFSDRLAYGAIDECLAQGFDVPGDISVTGFDDLHIGSPDVPVPALTTIRQDAFEKGRRAAQALLMKKASKDENIDIKAALVVRDSTAVRNTDR